MYQRVRNQDYDFWLMKFDNVSKNGDHGLEDIPEYTLIEYAYYKMALDAGIQMNECRIYSNAGENHFLTKRFDRVNGKKIHMQSLGAMAHISYKEPGLCSYEMAAGYMREMKLPMTDIQQFFCRMVFNCVAVNQDKRFSKYKGCSVQEFRFALSEEIRQQIFFAGFVKTAENSIKSQRILRALKQLIYRQGYHL